MATRADLHDGPGVRGAGRPGSRRVLPRKLGEARAVCAALVWIGLNVAAGSSLFEPLPDIALPVWGALAAAATLGAGLLAGRRQFLALALVPLLLAPVDGIGSHSDAAAALPFLAAIAATAVIACGVAACRILPARFAVIAGALLLAAPLPLVTWGADRTIWPHDARPAHPLPVDVHAGSFQGLGLGQLAGDARRALPGSVQTAAAPPRPLDQPSAPLGVASYPGDATSVRGRGVALLVEHGRVVMLFITNPRAEAIAGVGVGDNLGVARDRLRGLRCEQSNEGEPTCGGRLGHVTVLFVGDPIKTIALSAIDTGWCFVPSASCHRPSPARPLRVR